MLYKQILESSNAKKEGEAIRNFASIQHENWRKGYIASNGDVPRVKKNSDGTEGDINKPFGEIHPDWQRENIEAGKAALNAVKRHGNNLEKAAEHVHNEWMKRNPKADYNAAQHVPYSQLPEDEKEKDREHVRTISGLLNKNIKENTMLDLEKQLQEAINEMKFPDINSGRVNLNLDKPTFDAVISPFGKGHVADIYHTNEAGERTKHDFASSQNPDAKKGIEQNIKKKYGNIQMKYESYEYDVEAMLEYIEDLENQLDEISDKTRRNYLAGRGEGTGKEYEDLANDPKTIQGMSRNWEPGDTARKLNNAYKGVDTANRKLYNKPKHGPVKSEPGAVSDSYNYDAETENPIIEMIDSLMSGELVESNALFYDLLAYKINEKVELKKIEVAQDIFGESKDEDEDDDEDYYKNSKNKSDEEKDEDEKEATKDNPIVQLRGIAGYEGNLATKYPELTASGKVDQRSLNAANSAAAKKRKESAANSIPKFRHKNGETSDISQEHAQHIVDALTHPDLNKQVKEKAVALLHGSKAGLEKIKATILKSNSLKPKSIFGSKDARTA